VKLPKQAPSSRSSEKESESLHQIGDINKMKLEDIRHVLQGPGYYEVAMDFERMLERLERRRPFQFLAELLNTSCLLPCLDFLSAKDLTFLSRCSKKFLEVVRNTAEMRIRKIVGTSCAKEYKIVPYIKGRKEDVQKQKRSTDFPDENTYENMKVKSLRKILRDRRLPYKGKKAELVERLLKDDKKNAASSVRRDLRYLWEREWLQPFYVDQWLDAKDTTKKWLEAQIIEVEGTNVAIHYKGWKKKYDEWLDLSRGSPDWDRVARPLSRFREHPETTPQHAKFVEWVKSICSRLTLPS